MKERAHTRLLEVLQSSSVKLQHVLVEVAEYPFHVGIPREDLFIFHGLLQPFPQTLIHAEEFRKGFRKGAGNLHPG